MMTPPAPAGRSYDSKSEHFESPEEAEAGRDRFGGLSRWDHWLLHRWYLGFVTSGVMVTGIGVYAIVTQPATAICGVALVLIGLVWTWIAWRTYRSKFG